MNKTLPFVLSPPTGMHLAYVQVYTILVVQLDHYLLIGNVNLKVWVRFELSFSDVYCKS